MNLPLHSSSYRIGRFHLTPRRILGLALAVLVLSVGGFAGTYLLFFNDSAPAPLTLSNTPTGSVTTFNAARVAGAWTVAPASVVGYRVREKLAMLPAKSDAVGRTSDVAGSISLMPSGSGVMLTAANFITDVRTLKSDRSMRDMRIHSIGLQSDQYPTASFKLTTPVSLPPAALQGKVVHTTVTGNLTIHGTTQKVTIPLTARLKSGQIETVGSVTYPFQKFGMTPPSIGGFVTVENHFTMEFDLRFQRGGSTAAAAKVRSIAALKPQKSSSFMPAGAPPGGQNNKRFQAFAACMSKHGVTMQAGGPPPGPGARSTNPKMAAALKACGSLQPGPGGFGGPPPGSAPGQSQP